MYVCLLWVLCVIRYRSLRRADHSPTGVLSNVVCRCVWSRNLVNGEDLACWAGGACCAKNKQMNKNSTLFYIYIYKISIFGDLCSSNFASFARLFNHSTPNDPYSGRTAPLTSKRCILYIYSTNTGTEYFKHCIYSPFFSLSLQNAVCFIILTYLVPILFTFYIQGVLKFQKIIPAPKG